MTTEQHNEASALLSKIYQLEAHLHFTKEIESENKLTGIVPMIMCPIILKENQEIKFAFRNCNYTLKDLMEKQIKEAKERLAQI